MAYKMSGKELGAIKSSMMHKGDKKRQGIADKNKTKKVIKKKPVLKPTDSNSPEFQNE